MTEGIRKYSSIHTIHSYTLLMHAGDHAREIFIFPGKAVRGYSSGARPLGRGANSPLLCLEMSFMRDLFAGLSLEVVAVAQEGVELDAVGFGDDLGVPVQEDGDGGVGGGPVIVAEVHPIRVVRILG